MSRETVRIEDLQTRIGESLGQSTWRTVDQQRIDGFADLTEDPQWIHTDPARGKGKPLWRHHCPRVSLPVTAVGHGHGCSPRH